MGTYIDPPDFDSLKKLIIPFLGHKLHVKHFNWHDKKVMLECKDKCTKNMKIKIQCSVMDLQNLEANVWPDIIKGE